MRETILRLEGGKLNFSPLNWEHSHKVEEAEVVIRYNGTKQLEGSWGSCTYDVCTEGGGRVSEILTKGREVV